MESELKELLLKKYYDDEHGEVLLYEGFELPTFKSSRVDDIMLDKFSHNTEGSYSGYYQIEIETQNKDDRNSRKPIEIPLEWMNIKEEENILEKIKNKSKEIVNSEELETVLTLNSNKFYIFLIPREDCFLMVDLKKNKRGIKNFKMELTFRREKVSQDNIRQKIQILIEKYLLWQYENKKNEYYKYPKYLDNRFQPFQKFLEAERKAITRDDFKPKAKYIDIEFKRPSALTNYKSIRRKVQKKEKIDGDYNKDKANTDNSDDSDLIAILIFEDIIPRQLREARNKIKVIWNEEPNDIKGENKKENRKKTEKSIIVSVENWDDHEEFVLIFTKQDNVRDLKKAGKKGIIQLHENLTNYRRKQNALDMLRQPYLTPLQNLVDMMLRPEVFSPLVSKKVVPYDERIKENNIETKNQYQALEKINSSEDLTIIQGPPGSGKTTLIVELVKQAVSRRERVLMCAPTHVAVDNILEMLDKKPDLHLQMVRVGRGYRIQEDLKKYLLNELVKSWQQFTSKSPQIENNFSLELNQKDRSNNGLLEINQYFLANVKNKTGLIKDMIINTSNLVCGTSSGVVAIYGRNNLVDDFDLMIIDESSKATILEFLIAATRAKRWVIIGDQNQLSPYIEDREIRIFFHTYFNKYFEEEEIQQLNRESKKLLRKKQRYDSAEWRPSDDVKVHDFIKLLMIRFRTIYEGTHFVHRKSYIKKDLDEIHRLFKRDRRKLLMFRELIEILGSCYHYFYNKIYRIDKSRFQMLNYQYRMPPILSKFISNTFYNGELCYSTNTETHGLNIEINIVLPKISIKEFPLFTFLSTNNYHKIIRRDQRRHRSSSWYNPLETEIIILLLSQIYETFKNRGINNCWRVKSKEHPIFNKDNPLTIGVISFYAAQFGHIIRKVQKLDFIEKVGRTFFKFKGLNVKIQISIVDRFQGREKDIIIIPLTRSNKFGNIGFLKSRQRANVAFSRAKQNLFIIGNHLFFENLHDNNENEPYIKLANYCKKNKILFNLIPKNEIIEVAKSQKSKREKEEFDKSIETFKKEQKIHSSFKNRKLKEQKDINQINWRQDREHRITKKRKKSRVVKVISSHHFSKNNINVEKKKDNN